MALLIWQVDSLGYELSKDRKTIRRLGGDMAPYAVHVDVMDEPLHLRFCVHMRFASVDPTSGPETLLAFVRNNGFLGLNGNPAVEEESVSALFDHACRLYSILDTPAKDLSRQQLEQFNLGFPAGLGISLEKTDDVPKFEMHPKTLLAAIWLLTAQQVSGQVEWRRCAYHFCEKWIRIVPGEDKRHDRRAFCSPSHRTLQSRLKKLPHERKSARTAKRAKAK